MHEQQPFVPMWRHISQRVSVACLSTLALQIPVECSPGTTYGRYFHLLLQTRGLLLLGVHRLVQQDGVSFRATITNPSYVSCKHGQQAHAVPFLWTAKYMNTTPGRHSFGRLGWYAARWPPFWMYLPAYLPRCAAWLVSTGFSAAKQQPRVVHTKAKCTRVSS